MGARVVKKLSARQINELYDLLDKKGLLPLTAVVVRFNGLIAVDEILAVSGKRQITIKLLGDELRDLGKIQKQLEKEFVR